MGALATLRPELPLLDPMGCLVPGVVPERKRYCSGCDTKLKRDNGFCPKCGQEYSFVPSLNPGDMVAEKYEIKGTVAFGGLGWIYLALDTVLTRWVILKGLLNAKDPRMLEVAVKEREFLAAVKHPNIVGIYDFVTHGAEGYIVMEYVNGRTLMTLRKEKGAPLPVSEAVSYILEILPAFGYLDSLGLVYCDFKPDNAMLEDNTVKLIDMGAVRSVDDTTSDIYGSRGYSAPEAGEHPSHLSDLYSVGRALAVLVADFDFQGKFEHQLPPQNDIPLFRDNDALYRFLLKATRSDPTQRFVDAEDMTVQLLGVLRQLVDPGVLGAVESHLFDRDSDHGPDSGTYSLAAQHKIAVPLPKPDPSDPAAPILSAASAISDPARRLALFDRALRTNPRSVSLQLRRYDELVSLGQNQEAKVLLDLIEKQIKDEKLEQYLWQVHWFKGRAFLAAGQFNETFGAFEAVLNELPGELGPRQALARACELSGDLLRASAYYDMVSRVDPSHTSASFGLARCCEIKGELDGAVAAYQRVPSSSGRYVAAQMSACRALCSAEFGSVTMIRVASAGEILEGLEGMVDGLEFLLLKAHVLEQAALLTEEGGSLNRSKFLGVAPHATRLRTEAETLLRQCARMATNEHDRIARVDHANRVRPWSIT